MRSIVDRSPDNATSFVHSYICTPCTTVAPIRHPQRPAAALSSIQTSSIRIIHNNSSCERTRHSATSSWNTSNPFMQLKFPQPYDHTLRTTSLAGPSNILGLARLELTDANDRVASYRPYGPSAHVPNSLFPRHRMCHQSYYTLIIELYNYKNDL